METPEDISLWSELAMRISRECGRVGSLRGMRFLFLSKASEDEVPDHSRASFSFAANRSMRSSSLDYGPVSGSVLENAHVARSNSRSKPPVAPGEIRSGNVVWAVSVNRGSCAGRSANTSRLQGSDQL